MTDSRENPSTSASGESRIRQIVTIGGIVILLLIAFLWFQSYFNGTKHYQSIWRKTGEANGASERANWLFSNYGSFGIAWRRQEGTMQETLPENSREFSRFAASRAALGQIHPEGIVAWHWISHSSTPPAMAGSIRHFYGDLFIPYWIPFLVFLVLVVSVNGHRTREQAASIPSIDEDPENRQASDPENTS